LESLATKMASPSVPPNMTEIVELCKNKNLLISVIQTLHSEDTQIYLQFQSLDVSSVSSGFFIPSHDSEDFLTYSIASLKKGGRLEATNNPRHRGSSTYEVLFETNRALGPHCIALFLLNFYGIKLTDILAEINPLELAQCCWDVWCEVYGDEDEEPHIHEQRLHFLISNCIEKHFKDIVSPSSETKAAMEELEKEFKPWALLECRNEGLMKYLLEQDRLHPHAIMETMHTHAWIYCAEQLEAKNSAVLGICPKMETVEKPKSELRLRQKFEEYEALYLRPRVNVYGEFKDLFRGSVDMDVIRGDNDLRERLKQHLVEVKLTVTNQICDLKLILAIKGDKFELKVVPSGPKARKAHEFYELQRDGSVDNILDFISRSLKKEAESKKRRGKKRSAEGDPEDAQTRLSPPQPEDTM
jgi:hypothetical protein